MDQQNSEFMVESIGVRKVYDTGKVRVEALKGLDFKVRRGEMVAIMGPSGCGKTTLLNCLSGIDSVTSGVVKIAGTPINKFTDNELTAFRAKHMGFIFQTYNLLPVLSAVENVELSMLVSGVKPKEARLRAEKALALVGISELAAQRPAELSGGQRQRVTIARALATQPDIVWADEPTGALDSENSNEVMDLMCKLNKENGLTFVMVTHSLEVGSRAQRMVRMRDGMIVDDQPITNNAHTQEVAAPATDSSSQQ